MFNVQYTKDLNVNAPYKMLIYGSGGIGKTALIPTVKNPIIILSENGNPLIGLSGYNLPFIKINSFDEFIRILNFLITDTRFNSVVFDSISHVSEIIISEALKSNKHGQKAYGDLLDKFITIFELFDSIPKDIICLGKLEKSTNEEGINMYNPLFAGQKVTLKSLHYFDATVALRMNPDGSKFLQTETDGLWQAKARSPYKIGGVHDPNISKLLNKIRGINEANKNI